MHPLNNNDGAIAQFVEQRTENPCVPGSIPGGTTERKRVTKVVILISNGDKKVVNNKFDKGNYKLI